MTVETTCLYDRNEKTLGDEYPTHDVCRLILQAKLYYTLRQTGTLASSVLWWDGDQLIYRTDKLIHPTGRARQLDG